MSSEWSYSSNSALRRQRRYERTPAICGTPSSQSHSTPANLSSPRPANTCASDCWPAARMCTPKQSPSVSAEWQREVWATETSADGGSALNDETDVATSPHGSPSGRRAVMTATPEARPAIASRKISKAAMCGRSLKGSPYGNDVRAQDERCRSEPTATRDGRERQQPHDVPRHQPGRARDQRERGPAGARDPVGAAPCAPHRPAGRRAEHRERERPDRRRDPAAAEDHAELVRHARPGHHLLLVAVRVEEAGEVRPEGEESRDQYRRRREQGARQCAPPLARADQRVRQYHAGGRLQGGAEHEQRAAAALASADR